MYLQVSCASWASLRQTYRGAVVCALHWRELSHLLDSHDRMYRLQRIGCAEQLAAGEP
jgi:hypothetical protein